jgi:hypothetical protein
MKTNKPTILSNNIFMVAVVTILILTIPLVAMQFSSEVNWSVADFIIMGVLLFGTGTILTYGVSKLKSRNHRIIFGIAVALSFLYIWAELAVGIFTNLGS